MGSFQNLKKIFCITAFPDKDNISRILNSMDTSKVFQNIFKKLLAALQRSKHFEKYKTINGKYLLNVDGTEYFQSKKIHCSDCLNRGRKNNKYYSHQVLQAVFAHPNLKQVIPINPEEISNSCYAKYNYFPKLFKIW